jgi:hypothetical protein
MAAAAGRILGVRGITHRDEPCDERRIDDLYLGICDMSGGMTAEGPCGTLKVVL